MGGDERGPNHRGGAGEWEEGEFHIPAGVAEGCFFRGENVAVKRVTLERSEGVAALAAPTPSPSSPSTAAPEAADAVDAAAAAAVAAAAAAAAAARRRPCCASRSSAASPSSTSSSTSATASSSAASPPRQPFFMQGPQHVIRTCVAGYGRRARCGASAIAARVDLALPRILLIAVAHEVYVPASTLATVSNTSAAASVSTSTSVATPPRRTDG